MLKAFRLFLFVFLFSAAFHVSQTVVFAQTPARSCDAICEDAAGCTCAASCSSGRITITQGMYCNEVVRSQGAGRGNSNVQQTGCEAGAAGVNLSDCFVLNDRQSVADVYNNPTVLINRLVTFSFVIAGMMIFFFILYGGFLFITGDAKGKDKAAEILTQAAIGFVVMFSAYWILQIVELVTGANIPL